ncbi:MAG: glycosyltransferase [Arenicellales bacterium]
MLIQPQFSLSIVIPTYQQTHLDAVFLALSEQKTRAKFEVILVENGVRSEATQTSLEKYQYLLNIRYFFEQQAGANRARNIGVLAAKASIISLLDDDCIPNPDWVDAIISTHQKEGSDNVVIGGRSILKFADEPPAWIIGQFREVLSELHWSETQRALEEGEWIVGGNMSFSRSIFESIGGFENALGLSGGHWMKLCHDEYEFYQRAKETLGSAVLYEPSIIVDHLTPKSRLSLKYLEGRFMGQGLSDVLLALCGTNKSTPLVVEEFLFWTFMEVIDERAETLEDESKGRYLFMIICCRISLMEGVTSADSFKRVMDDFRASDAEMKAQISAAQKVAAWSENESCLDDFSAIGAFFRGEMTARSNINQLGPTLEDIAYLVEIRAELKRCCISEAVL